MYINRKKWVHFNQSVKSDEYAYYGEDGQLKRFDGVFHAFDTAGEFI